MTILRSKHRLFTIDSPKVMGILNCTPDSFYKESRVNSESVLNKAAQMFEEGADILDIGGQSTRPGAQQIGETAERDRVVPLIEMLRKAFPKAWLSIDTYYASVAKAAVNAGADMINDISAGLDDPNMLSTVSKLNVPYIAMHKKGTPETMQDKPNYKNPSKEIIDFFIQHLKVIKSAGIKDCILDPGFGFGKSIEHNFKIVKDLSSFNMFEEPLLVGFSRKSMIWKSLNIQPAEALNGTTFLHAIALQKGALILRVHDVKEARECIRLNALLNK